MGSKFQIGDIVINRGTEAPVMRIVGHPARIDTRENRNLKTDRYTCLWVVDQRIKVGVYIDAELQLVRVSNDSLFAF